MTFPAPFGHTAELVCFRFILTERPTLKRLQKGKQIPPAVQLAGFPIYVHRGCSHEVCGPYDAGVGSKACERQQLDCHCLDRVFRKKGQLISYPCWLLLWRVPELLTAAQQLFPTTISYDQYRVLFVKVLRCSV